VESLSCYNPLPPALRVEPSKVSLLTEKTLDSRYGFNASWKDLKDPETWNKEI
jgi:hypothetical protein